MVVLVTAEAVSSAWVRSEIDAFLNAPGTRRLAGIFFNAAYPQILPDTFAGLKAYRGVRADAADLDPPVVRDEIVQQIRRTFRSVRVSALRTAFISTVVLLAILAFWTQSLFRNRAELRDEWLKRAEATRVELRNDLAEFAISKAAASDPGSAPELTGQYREVRAARLLMPRTKASTPASFSLIHIGNDGAQPFTVFHDHEDESLWLDVGNQRVLIARECGDEPRVVSRGHDVVFSCGSALARLDVAKPVDIRRVPLRAPVSALSTVDGEVRVLARSGAAARVNAFDPQTLAALWEQPLTDVPTAAETGLCKNSTMVAWAANTESGELIIRRWSRGRALPAADHMGRVAEHVNGAEASSDCERFFIAGAQWLRVRIDKLQLVNAFDNTAERIRPVDDASGYEAVYAAANRDLRAFVLTSPIVRNPEIRTLAAGIRAFEVWPGAGSKLRIAAADERWLTVFVDGKPVARYPGLVNQPARILASRDGRFVAVQGEDGIAIWESPDIWTADAVPEPDVLSRELKLWWPAPARNADYRVPAH